MKAPTPSTCEGPRVGREDDADSHDPHDDGEQVEWIQAAPVWRQREERTSPRAGRTEVEDSVGEDYDGRLPPVLL